jgi:hypothetical protein
MTIARSTLLRHVEQRLALLVRSKRRWSSLAGRVELGQTRRKKLVDELGDASAARARGNEGGALLDHWQGIRDCYRHPADVKQGKVVLGVADADAIER